MKANRYASIGNTQVELIGKPFVVAVDTFDGEDWFEGYFENDRDAINYAQTSGGAMLKKHAYNAEGIHIGEGGTF